MYILKFISEGLRKFPIYAVMDIKIVTDFDVVLKFYNFQFFI